MSPYLTLMKYIFKLVLLMIQSVLHVVHFLKMVIPVYFSLPQL